MDDRFVRTRMLLGDRAMERLKNARVAVFGVGGVGGYAVEALVRSGVGELDIFDNDTVSVSNLNRQIIATDETVGQFKVDVMLKRAKLINPGVKINAHKCFFMPENAGEFDFSEYSYVIDAVDTVTAKIEIIMRAKAAGIGVISCMGAGNKRDASRFEVADIFETSVCPLARTMRYELKKRGVRDLKVVYSKEKPITPKGTAEAVPGRRTTPASCAFVPAVAGLIAAGEVVNDIAGWEEIL
ncbi:MAG: tRNA threonylcarbamoyladenosine dehydratase [Clostridia bacterium]|nr:tRNA threonylcarbamoyladenosine dehydratase [Clostridia bacterium]